MDDGRRELGIDGVVDAEEVGRGGFAVVYRARQPAFDRTVAVKVLDARPDETALARFEREIRAMGALSEHPAIATVLDAGTTGDGRPYLLMPFFSGGSLQDALAEGRQFTVEEATRIGMALADALEAAHAEGILHRDVKPANVMVGRYGDPRLVDFGIARIAGGQQTTTGVVTATLNHAAPELLDGDPPSVASDVYALGSTIHTLVTGRPPFASDTDQSVVPLIRRIVAEPVPTFDDGGSGLCAVLARSMAKDPAARFASASDMEAALAAVREGRGEELAALAPAAPLPVESAPAPAGAPSSPVPSAVPAEVTRLAPPPAMPSSAVPERAGRDPRLLGLVVGLVVVLGVVGAFVLLRGDRGEDGGVVGAGDTAGDAATEQVADGEPNVPVPGGLPPELLGGVDAEELTYLSSPAEAADISPGSVIEIGLPARSSTALLFDIEEEGRAIRVSTAGTGDVDPVAGLYRDGELLLADDDGSGGLDVLMDLPEALRGSYELRLAGLMDEPGPLGVSLQVVEVQELPDGPLEGTLGDVHDIDVYRVAVQPGQARGLRVDTESEITLRAVGPDGEFVDSNSGGGGIEMDLSTSGPGVFWVTVGSAGPEQLSYTVSPLAFGQQRPQPPVSAALDPADIVDPGSVSRTVDAGVGAVDLEVGEAVGIPVVADRAGVLRVLVRSTDGAVDPMASLWTADGSLLAASDDEGDGAGGQDALMDVPVVPGEYVVVTSDLGSDSPGRVEVLIDLVQPVGFGPVAGELRAPDLPDVFQIDVGPGNPPPDTVRLGSDVEGLLRVIAGDGAVLASTNGGGNPPLPLLGLGEGRYYLVVSAPDEAGPYRLLLGP
ncbi:serine/threonine-protein kinase [Euzebya rosea]|uniref:serine/threonine-protein kinase n=1 Tax=Euzebya rosea TaxID=2052804 RepID=UPI000D3E9AA4|nr:serine/threonine-protein kinase [Euzebya rosea]